MTEVFSVGEPKAIDLSHHLSVIARARRPSPLKDLQRFFGKPGIIAMGGGFPSPLYFPFASVSAEGLVPESFPLTPNQTASSSNSAFSWLWKILGVPTKEKTTPLTVNKYPDQKDDLNLATALQYGLAHGLPQLQKFIEDFGARVYKPASKDVVYLVHHGNTDGWFKILMTLCNPGEGLLVAEWTYPSAMACMKPLGIKPVPLPIDEQGISSVGLRKVLAEWDEDSQGMARPHVLYTVPIGQNPTGATMGPQRKKEIYEICVEFDVIIVEDDPYYFLQLGEYLPKAQRSTNSGRAVSDEEYLANLTATFLNFDYQGRVIRLDSLSKIIAPGSRLGWFTCNPLFAERLERQAETTTQAPCGFGQTMVTSLLLHWKFDGYVRWLRALGAQYTERRDFLIDCFADEFQLEAALEHSGAWKGNTVYRAFSGRGSEKFRIMTEKAHPGVPMFSFVIPTSGMYIWMQLHLNHHPAFPDEAPAALEMKLWEQLALAGVLFSPGWMFSAETEQEDPVGGGHFRISFSHVSYDAMKGAVVVFGTEVRKFWTQR
ncbi:hypothetical protein HGRIS_009954 [Hohenbuehelia grisea]|uniref:Aminotransferase class I/classII large domain-containing protein n=1 Tax=Hohenbuehelia grisea TaxID=104357 RepID=A0ABR3J301_9AGAR